MIFINGSYPSSGSAAKNPAIADGIKGVRFCREMDGNNINAPLHFPCGSCMAFSLSQRLPRQASGFPTQSSQVSVIHLQAATVTGVQMATATAIVSIRSMVFSSLKPPSPFPIENNFPIRGISCWLILPHSRNAFTRFLPESGRETVFRVRPVLPLRSPSRR